MTSFYFNYDVPENPFLQVEGPKIIISEEKYIIKWWDAGLLVSKIGTNSKKEMEFYKLEGKEKGYDVEVTVNDD